MRYFLRPTKLRWSRKENLAGKAPRPWGWIYSQTRSARSERPAPLHLGPTKTATHLARSRSVRIGVVRLEKSLVANLSAKRLLSVAKLSAKRNVSLAKRDFLVAKGRMAADFSSPEGLEKVRDETMKRSLKLVRLQCVLFFLSPELHFFQVVVFVPFHLQRCWSRRSH